MNDVILKIENFSKFFRSHWTYQKIEAVRDLSLEVYRGESFGFLGHNGAGKTTTIKSILGLIHKSEGRFIFNGKELQDATDRRDIGYLPEHPYFYDHLTVEETLDFFARLYDVPKEHRKQKIEEAMALVRLTNRRKSSVRSLSIGWQQRVGFAQAILNKPKLLLLDEPFSGLDPLGRLEIRRLILDLKRQGTTVFLSSHILSDVEDICDRVAIMANGELKRVFGLRETPELFGQSFELTLRGNAESRSLMQKLEKLAAEVEINDTANGEFFLFRFTEYQTAQAAMSQAISEGIKVEEFKSCGLSLEDIFMDITSAEQEKRESSTEKSLL